VEDGLMLFGLFRRPAASSSAQTAKDRLQVLLAHDRQDRARPDYLPLLQRDILEVIRKYVQVAGDKVQFRLQRGDQASILGIEIELPGPRALPLAPGGVTGKPAFAR
jgi:cell division topological specificity factor